MPSVFEFLGIKKQLSTPVPQLGINNALYKRQIESQQYFTIESAAEAADGNKLAIHTKKGQDFRTSNPQHIEFLNQCITLVKEKSNLLKSTDQKIAGSVVFGVTATALSFLPVVGFLGWVGWAATAYFINQRATAYAEYHEALTLLVGACNWSLGQGPEERKDTIPNLTKNEAIRAMMAVLYPVLTEVQVRHLIADDVEEVFAKELQDYEQRFELGFKTDRFFSKKDDTIALSKKGAEFSRCIYGFNKGGFTDFLDAIVSILPDLYKAAVHGGQQLKSWWQEKNNAPEKEDEAHNHEISKVSL
ncbi:hypothetical protein OQJ26_01235 [Legionella sp. PATHC038]|uniref:hypothetical protein n=1 Tax=Legionella sheltonii TaxID=2992041 RepID=UPI0022434A75|nr:hypothetical protein [Legionella sp. PATHC038]MCW8397418.1 hypothetical protein [Legionella sp. PATHC038]